MHSKKGALLGVALALAALLLLAGMAATVWVVVDARPLLAVVAPQGTAEKAGPCQHGSATYDLFIINILVMTSTAEKAGPCQHGLAPHGLVCYKIPVADANTSLILQVRPWQRSPFLALAALPCLGPAPSLSCRSRACHSRSFACMAHACAHAMVSRQTHGAVNPLSIPVHKPAVSRAMICRWPFKTSVPSTQAATKVRPRRARPARFDHTGTSLSRASSACW